MKQASVKERVCRNCKRIVSDDTCDVCGSTNLASTYQGLLIVLKPESSEIATLLKIKKEGYYAVKVK
ncbi:MAG: transcription elongation factor subunit Spt4 [Nitrososphaerota archaeon]